MFVGGTKLKELAKLKNMLREIMNFLVNWKNLLIDYSTWKDDFFKLKHLHPIKH